MRRGWVAVAVVVVAVPLVAVGAASWFLDGDAIKARLIEQVQRTTGRTLTIDGPIGLAWSLSPTLVLNGVSLSNPVGFPTPTMAHVARIEARIGLGGLLQRRVVIERVVVVAPSVGLERNAAGQPNWIFSPAQSQTAVAPVSAPRGERLTLSIGAVDITDATIGWARQTITAPHLAYDPDTGGVSGTLEANGTELALSGTAGPFGAAAFPVDLHLIGGGAMATLLGTSASATLTVAAADLSSLSPLIGHPLPTVHDVSIVTTLPGPSAIHAQVGGATLGRLVLGSTTLTAASLTEPAVVTGHATFGSLPLDVNGHFGSVAALLRGPTPVEARFEAPGLSITGAGTLDGAGDGTMQIGVTSADLRATGEQAGLRLPALHSLQTTATLTLQPGRAGLNSLHLTSAQGDLAGDLALGFGSRPSVTGTLASQSFDLHAFEPAASAPAIATTTPAAPAPAAPQPARLIPDTALPFDDLREVDADLTMTAAALHLAGATYTNVVAHAVLANGSLRLDPVSTSLGTATAHGTLQVAAAATPPTVHLTIDAPDLPFGALMALDGGAASAPGTVDLRADLSGSGSTLHAIASTLTGRAGVALVDAQVDNAMLNRLVAGPLREAGVSFDEAGSTAIRCGAVAVEATAGRVRLTALTLDTSRLALDGSGDVDLGTEALDLHLRPELRLGGGLSVPIRVRGTLAAPKAQLDPAAFASGRVGIVLGGPPPPDRCGPALAAAREGAAGPAAAAPSPPRKLKPADILRGLLR